MKRTLKFTAPVLALALMLSAVTTGQAADKATASAVPADAQNAVTLDKVNLGTYVYGAKVTPETLKGKVVVFEYWGDTCGPCLKGIPKLVKLQKKYGNTKFQIVANQAWTKDVDTAKRAWVNSGGSEDIAVINHGKLQGAKVKYYPMAFVLDHNGKLLWSGHPGSKKFTATIETALKNVPSQN